MWDNLAVWQQFWLTGLLIVWALLLFGGFVLGRERGQPSQRMPIWTRMMSSAALVIAGWSWYLFSRDSVFALLSLFTAAGMTLGFVGDVFMAGLMPLGNRVLGGIAAFGAGHLLYISGLVWYANTAGLEMNAARTAALIVWLAVRTGGWYLVVRRGQQAGILHYAALPYALLLAGTAGTATGLATQQATFTWTALGAALFLLSDLILAGELFSGLHFRYVGDIVWLTYGPGQMLIVFGTGSALLWVSL